MLLGVHGACGAGIWAERVTGNTCVRWQVESDAVKVARLMSYLCLCVLLGLLQWKETEKGDFLEAPGVRSALFTARTGALGHWCMSWRAA